jgi:hypothetical protein
MIIKIMKNATKIIVIVFELELVTVSDEGTVVSIPPKDINIIIYIISTTTKIIITVGFDNKLLI